jgi:hypothetical protein
MFKLTYIKLCYYLIMIHLASFFYQSRSAQIAHITTLGSFTLYIEIDFGDQEFAKKRICKKYEKFSKKNVVLKKIMFRN